MKHIYAVGVLQLKEQTIRGPLIADQRLWHLFASLEEAQECVLQNQGDLFEYYYNYALIEEVYVFDKTDHYRESSGLPQEWWYHADFSKMDENKNPTITAVEKPAVLEKMVYFWVG